MDIFSDAASPENTLVLLFLRHLPPINDSECCHYFQFAVTIFFMKTQESCPSLAGELTCSGTSWHSYLCHCNSMAQPSPSGPPSNPESQPSHKVAEVVRKLCKKKSSAPDASGCVEKKSRLILRRNRDENHFLVIREVFLKIYNVNAVIVDFRRS